MAMRGRLLVSEILHAMPLPSRLARLMPPRVNAFRLYSVQ